MKYFKKKYNPQDYTLQCIPVLPVSFRHERLGFYKGFQDDLNVLYRNVIRQNSGLQKLLENEEGTEESRIGEG
jgi:DNA-directed RNA polymerase beta' subunit